MNTIFDPLVDREADPRPRLGMTATVKATGQESNGAFGLVELTLSPHFHNMASHWHKQTMEAIYVLDGTLAFTISDETFTGTRGRVVIIPPYTVHHLWNPTASPAMVLQLYTPGGFEAYFAELVAASSASPIDEDQLNVIAAKYDQFIFALNSAKFQTEYL